MKRKVTVVGHRNPDNDSICSAITYAYLKNQMAQREAAAAGLEEPAQAYVPARLGPLSPETAWLLGELNIPSPQYVGHVHMRVWDVMTENPISISHGATIMEAGRSLRQHNIRSLVVTKEDGSYGGLVTTRMIAERYISATDKLLEEGANDMSVAADLVNSLYETVADIMESDVVVLDKETLLKEAVSDLMASPLREGVVLDDEGMCVGIVTRSDIANAKGRQVILVDHNETRQAAPGIDEADVIEVVDHHRIADVHTSQPIKFINLPVGCTATIIAGEYEAAGVEIPQDMAKLMLSAILTDTVILRSITTTQRDRDVAEKLAALAGLEVQSFGVEVFKHRAAEGVPSVERIVNGDAKEFLLGGNTVLISQFETVDLDSVLAQEQEIRACMQKLQQDKEYEFVLLMVTDILAEGSQFICEGNRRIMERVFNIKCTGQGGTWMPGILSRKKQVAALILGELV